MYHLWSLLALLFDIAMAIVILRFAIDLLVHFKVLDAGQAWVQKLSGLLNRLTEPALRPIRAFLPNLGGIDISPAVLLVLIWLVEWVLFRFVFASMMMMP